jgi:hypothetical protein
LAETLRRMIPSFVRGESSRKARTAELIVLGALVSSMGGCGHRTGLGIVDEDVSRMPSFAQESVEKLENQSSFRFRHRFERKSAPLRVEGDFEGTYLFPNRRSVKGILTLGDRTEKLDLVASKNSEYSLDPESGDWVERPASEETCPVAQLKKVMGLGGFKYLRRDKVGGKSTSLFSFEPSLAFLDPSMEKVLTGRIWVTERSGLPVKVEVRSKDGSLSWDMTLMAFNSPASISIPLRNSYEAEFVVTVDEREGLGKTVNTISERLALIELENVRLKSRTSGRFAIGFDSENSREEMIELVSRPGSLRVRLAVWPDGPVSQLSQEDIEETYGTGAELTHESGDLANALVLKEDLITSDDLVKSSLVFDEFSRPVVEIEYDEASSRRVEDATGEHVGRPLAFALDGEVLHAPIVRRPVAGNRLRIGGFTSATRAIAVSVVLQTEPLPLPVRLVSVGEVSR